MANNNNNNTRLVNYIGPANRLFSFLLFTFNLYYNCTIASYLNSDSNVWHYLTIWNLFMYILYFGLLLFLPYLPLFETSKKKEFLDTFHHSIIGPSGSFVTATFWSLYWIDRELVFPQALDDVFPAWHNHCLHTWIIFAFSIEEICFNHRLPQLKSSLAIWITYTFLYSINVFSMGILYNIWVYPVLAILSWPLRILFVIFIFTASLFILIGCRNFHIYIWS